MKNLFALIILCFLTIELNAQSNVKKFVDSPNDGWLVNMEKAYEISSKTNKPILANFTGSDWCGWCKKLKAEVFNKPEFKKWAADNVVLLELDFPRRVKLPQEQQQQNQSLQQAFGVTGFPTIWVFDLVKPADSKQFEIMAYGRTGYVRGGESAFIRDVNQMISKKEQAN